MVGCDRGVATGVFVDSATVAGCDGEVAVDASVGCWVGLAGGTIVGGMVDLTGGLSPGGMAVGDRVISKSAWVACVVLHPPNASKLISNDRIFKNCRREKEPIFSGSLDLIIVGCSLAL